MRKIAADLLIDRLIAWHVDTVFGLPGDGINGIMEALRRRADDIRFVLVHHEEAAAFMATAHAKATGQLGVCLATSGPGGVHLLNGLYDAKLDHQPVLAITGMQETSLLGTGYQQEVHLERLFIDVADYDVMVHVPAQLPTLVDIAVRRALVNRSVSHITIPNDIQVTPADAEPFPSVAPAHAPITAPTFIVPRLMPDDENLGKAADILNAGERVVLLVGAGALGARDEVLEVADVLAAPIVKTLPGKAVVPDDHPLTTGGLGLLGTKPSEEVMESCDTLLMVGTNFPYTKHLPEPGQCKVVQIDRSGERVGTRVPTDAPLVGDAAETLRALRRHLRPQTDRYFLEEAQHAMTEWRNDMDALEDADRNPIAPQYFMSVIDRLASEDAILSSDSGTIATWAARHWTIRGGREFYLSGNLATMAPGLPYAIAHQIAYPERQCIAFVGDGGFAMLMGEFQTACRYNLPVKIFVNNNGALGQILWEQMVLGYPEFGVRFSEYSNFAPWATACGGFGALVEEPADLEPAVRAAFAHPGPALVDCHVNPDEPPMPGKVTYHQAVKFAQAFLRGQPRKATIASTLFRDKLAELKN